MRVNADAPTSWRWHTVVDAESAGPSIVARVRIDERTEPRKLNVSTTIARAVAGNRERRAGGVRTAGFEQQRFARDEQRRASGNLPLRDGLRRRCAGEDGLNII